MSDVVSYTSVDQIEATMSLIGSMSTITSANIVKHASAAESEINAKIARRYSIPISGTVPILETLATDMAVYRILTGRAIIKEEHPWFSRYKDANKILDSIMSGTTLLITNSGDVISARSDELSGMQPWSNRKDYHPTHWEGPWTHHVQDEDKIDDESDERDFSTLGGRLK